MNPTTLLLTTCLFALAMLGHFVGDYILQNDWMALNKAQRNLKGWVTCSFHVILYTLAVMSFLSIAYSELFFNWKLWLIVSIPHYLIDHYSAASYIMKWKNGTKPFDVVKPNSLITLESLWKIGFTAPVYILNDNTLHWVMLYFTCLYMSNHIL